MLGNIKFIGELGKLDMLHEGILHRCIQQLLEKKKKKQTIQDMGEDYECLCQILKTIGKSLDHDKAKLWMDQYFDRIRTIMSNPELPSRIRFMLLDVLELRSNQWMPRKTMMDTGPKTIQQVREDAIRANHNSQQEYGGLLPHTTSALANLSMNTDMFGRPLNGTVVTPKSTMGDIFGPMSPPFMGSNTGIGTGPGVLDDFTPSFMSGNSGKQNNFNLKQAPFGNRGKQQEGRGGNSPRFEDRYRNRNNNTPPYQHPEKEADREDEADDRYSSSRNRPQNRDNYNNRYNSNNRDNRQQGSQNSYNRNNQNQEQNQQYKNRNDQQDRGGALMPKFPARQRSPYGQDDDDRPKENRSQDDNWRRDRTKDDRDQKQEGRDERSGGPYRYDRGREMNQSRKQDSGDQDQRRPGQDWNRPKGDWHSDRSDSGDRKPRDRDFSGKRDDYNQGEDRGRFQQGRGYNKDWDSSDNKNKGGDSYNKDRDYQRNDRRNFDDQRDKHDFRNGDVQDSRNQGDRFDRGRDGDRDFKSRDFNSDYRSNNRDFNRDNNRDFGGRDNRDFRDNREFRDGKGFRDFGEPRDRPGFDRGFQRGTGQQQQNRDGQQTAARELPPRFQKKQQQQQGTPPDPLFPTEIPSPGPEDNMSPMGTIPAPHAIPPGAPPQRFRHPLAPQHQPQIGFFPPRFPPPGGPPIRGPPPRGYPGGPPAPYGIPPPRYPMGGGSPRDGGSQDSPRDRDQGGSLPGGPSMSPPQNLPKGPAKVDEISLRPARNFPTMLRPGAPSMLPKSAQNPHLGPSSSMQIPDIHGPAPGGPQAVVKPTNLTIKQVPSSDKNREKDKRKVPNKEELKQATDEMIKAFLESCNIDETVNSVKEMKPPRRFMPEMISMMIVQGLEKGDTERENISSLILSMKQQAVLASDLYLDGLCNVLDHMSELEQEIPLVKSNVAKFAAQAVGSDIITLGNLAEILDNGAHYPFFLLCLQQLHKVKDKDWLIKNFNDSKIELLHMLPECDRTKERMVEILEDRNLSFMFPLLRVQSDLWRQVRADPNPGNFYKWIKENVDSNLQNDHGFINILMTTVLRYITGETTMKADQDPHNPDKSALDKEKDLLDKYRGVLQRFLLDHVDLQMTAIYAIQVFGHNADFPKGLMLRLFMHMYDMEIIDEETFLKWKEEVNDEYPGKGKVLFQVHQWLTWLEQAEEESEDED